MPKILLGVTGSIAAYKAADLISLLQKKGHSLKVIMTKNSTQFIKPLVFETLTKNPVYEKMFSKKAYEIEHISLAKEANILAVVPASANIIGKFSSGVADDLLSTTLLAFGKKPILIAPAMNTEMFENEIVQKNISFLKKLGVNFCEPKKSKLACGDYGKGALADISEIYEQIQKLIDNN